MLVFLADCTVSLEKGDGVNLPSYFQRHRDSSSQCGMDASAGHYNKQVNDDEIPLSERIARAQAVEARPFSEEDDVPLNSLGNTGRAEFTLSARQAADRADAHLSGDGENTAPIGKRACLFVHPGKSFSVAWGFLTVLVVVWVVFSLPFKLAFLSERCVRPDWVLLTNRVIIITLLFDC